MTKIKHSINNSDTDGWTTRVGKLIINFGFLEFETYLWLVKLSETPEKFSDFSKLQFSVRVKEIKKLINARAYSENWKTQALKIWDEGLEQAKFRNRIAHNPLVFWWKNEKEEGEPDFIGIPNFKGFNQSQNLLASTADMDIVINTIVSLATQLGTLREDWCKIRDTMDE